MNTINLNGFSLRLTIGNGSRIDAVAILTASVTIGDVAIVEAGSVVTHDVE